MIQLSEFDEYTITGDADVKNLPKPDQPLFEFNPGKNGYIFDETKHPYSVKVGERFKVAQSVNFGLPTPPKPVVPLPTPKLTKKIKSVTVADANDFDQMEIYLKQKFGIQEINIRKLDFDIAKQQMIQFENLADEYNIPDLVAIKDTEKGRQTLASVSRFGFGTSAQLDFNPAYYKKNKRSKKFDWYEPADVEIELERISKTINHSAVVDPVNEPIATMTHEFAHLFGSFRQTNMSATISDPKFDLRRKAFKEIKQIFSAYKTDLNTIELKLIKNEIDRNEYLNLRRERFVSRYGETCIDEFFAESFSMAKLNSNASIYAKQVLEVVNKYFKK